jgi:hypothetical protein
LACKPPGEQVAKAPAKALTDLLVSQLLTLYTTPVVYLYLDRVQLWFGRLRGGRGRRIAPGTALGPPDR